jgi:hypothetical protein
MQNFIMLQQMVRKISIKLSGVKLKEICIQSKHLTKCSYVSVMFQVLWVLSRNFLKKYSIFFRFVRSRNINISIAQIRY